jgi:archaeal flagellin FlaB
MTGLETAIILIAFVTVASVLAYSVLSAGIFSLEKAQETVYKGIPKASNSIELSSFVLG